MLLDLITRQVSGIYHNVLVIWFNNDITIMTLNDHIKSLAPLNWFIPTLFIEIFTKTGRSQVSEWYRSFRFLQFSILCGNCSESDVRGINFSSVFLFFKSNLGTVLTVWYILFFILFPLCRYYSWQNGVAQWVRSLDLTAHTSLSPIRREFTPSFVNYKKSALDSKPQVIKFTSCLPRVGGSLRVLRLPPPLKLVAMI